MFDKPLPHSDEMEQAVIASVLLGMDGAKQALTRMDPLWFYNEKNRVIFKVFTPYIEQSIPPDLTLACQWLTTAGVLANVGGMEYLAQCLDKCTTPGHVQFYITELQKLYLDRQILGAVYVVNNDPSFTNIEQLRLRSQERDCADCRGVIDVADCMPKITEMLQPMPKGLYDFFNMPEMDLYFNGTKPGEILTIGARPGTGKTVMATHIAIAFAKRYKEPVLYFSTEMPHEETLARVLSPLSRIPGWKFRKRYFDHEGNDIKAIGAAANELIELKFYMVDRSNPTMAEVRSAMIATKCKLVVIDYIQHMDLQVGPEGIPAALDETMKSIKSSCRDLGAMALITSQLDRGVDKLTVRQTPQLSDLKGGSGIEQESDAVILLHKHNKKDKDTKEPLVPDIRNVIPTIAIHAKNRHGKRDVSTQLIFDEKFIEFREWNTEEALKWAGQIVKKPAKEKKNEKSRFTWGGGTGTADPDSEEVP